VWEVVSGTRPFASMMRGEIIHKVGGPPRCAQGAAVQGCKRLVAASSCQGAAAVRHQPNRKTATPRPPACLLLPLLPLAYATRGSWQLASGWRPQRPRQLHQPSAALAALCVQVVMDDARPHSAPGSAREGYVRLAKECWARGSGRRPGFTSVAARLEGLLAELGFAGGTEELEVLVGQL
jgi:hypothetical protein